MFIQEVYPSMTTHNVAEVQAANIALQHHRILDTDIVNEIWQYPTTDQLFTGFEKPLTPGMLVELMHKDKDGNIMGDGGGTLFFENEEPEIYQTTKLRGTILENVVIDKSSGEIDLDDSSLAENTRGAYPLSFIPNASETGRTCMPKNIILLTCMWLFQACR